MEQLIEELIARIQIQKNDPWNKLGDSINIPIKITDILIKEIQHYNSLQQNFNLEKSNEFIIQQIIELIQNYADHVTSVIDHNLGDGIQKNLAAHEIIKLIKKKYDYQSN
jgi:hypothetical protein